VKTVTELTCGALIALVAGCGNAPTDRRTGASDQDPPSPPIVEARQKPAPQPSAKTPADPSLIDVDDLRERNAEDVVALLGKPQGKIQTKAGVLWLYAHWRVQFDTQNRVLGVEKDFPIPLAAFDAKLAGSTPSPDPRAPRPTGTAPAAPPSINVVSNNGQPVDLLPLMPDGKVTVVDFYADWCGACRQTGPYLERLAAQDPQVALVKVNIED